MTIVRFGTDQSGMGFGNRFAERQPHSHAPCRCQVNTFDSLTFPMIWDARCRVALVSSHSSYGRAGGAVFGDQCSPYSDTTVLSAMACGCDLMDHVLTQLPQALLAATISIVLYLGIGFIILW